MRVIETRIADIKILEPVVHGDARGFFMEAWKLSEFEEKICSGVAFVQDNHSRSKKGVVRGLHFQRPPFTQAKLVRCIVGNIFDVAVDIRRSSSSFGQWVAVELSAENKRQMWIPEGFAHGFVALSDFAEVCYKTNRYWHPEAEGVICWNDPDIGIQWPEIEELCQSPRDAAAPLLKDAVLF